MFQSTCLKAVHVGLLGLVLACFGFNTQLYGGNIVVDGGFEAADPTGMPGATDYFMAGQSIDGGNWIVGPDSEVGVDTQNKYVFAGNKSVFLNGSGVGPDSLYQTLTTVVGQIYTISFYANADTPNSFSVTFGGTPVTGEPTSITQNGFPSSTWLGSRLASQASTELASLRIHHDERGNRIDAVLFFQLRGTINIDRLDRVALPRQLLHSRAHLAAGSAPVGVEVEEDRLGGCGARWQCGDQGDQKGGDSHAARTPFPRDKPRVDAVTSYPFGPSLASCTSIGGVGYKSGWASVRAVRGRVVSRFPRPDWAGETRSRRSAF